MLSVALAVLVLAVVAITLLISSTSKKQLESSRPSTPHHIFSRNRSLVTESIFPFLQHCYVTGGSAGLGLALAILLTKKGADVSIVARNEEQLEKALEKLEVRLTLTYHNTYQLNLTLISTGSSDNP